MADKEKRAYIVTIWRHSISKASMQGVQRYINPHNGDQLIIEERVMPVDHLHKRNFLKIKAGRCASGEKVDFRWD